MQFQIKNKNTENVQFECELPPEFDNENHQVQLGFAVKNAVQLKTDLSGADLKGAYLWKANLRGANLRETDLRGADLWKADFKGADLRKTDFGGADLRGANLRGANLWEAIK